MADAPVRSLLAELGFNFDPTGADRFKSAFNDIKLTLKDAKGEFTEVDFKDFFSKMEKNFAKNAKNTEKSLKLQMLSMGFRIGRVMKKQVSEVFKTFATLDEAEASLRFKIGEEGLLKVQKTIRELPKDLRNLTTDLDLLNAVISSVSKAGDLDFVLKNLGTSAKLGLASRVNTQDVVGAVTNFIQTGGGVQGLADVGVFTPDQLDRFKRDKIFEQLAGTIPRQRQEFIQPFIEAREPSAQEFVDITAKSATGLMKQAESTKEDIRSFLGEKLVVPGLRRFFEFTDALKETKKKTEARRIELQGAKIEVKTEIIINDATDPDKVGKVVDDKMRKMWSDVVEDSQINTPSQSSNALIPPTP